MNIDTYRKVYVEARFNETIRVRFCWLQPPYLATVLSISTAAPKYNFFVSAPISFLSAPILGVTTEEIKHCTLGPPYIRYYLWRFNDSFR